MGDSKSFGTRGEYELTVHCMHGEVHFLTSDWDKGFMGQISVPWGVWGDVVGAATRDKVGEELVVGQFMKSYIAVKPNLRGISLEGRSPHPRVFVQMIIPWAVWEESIRWINGPGRDSVAGRGPGIVKKKEKTETRKIEVAWPSAKK